MRVIRNVSYRPQGGSRGQGDVFLPPGKPMGAPVLLIHGGGWNALAKESIEFLQPFFIAKGRPVFSINYRLLDEAPWPACGEDCLAAAHYLLEGHLAPHGIPARPKITICGASAGAHLALMTALKLSHEKVEAVIALAPPCRLDWVAMNRDPLGLHEEFSGRFFGKPVALNGREMREASPAFQVQSPLPPLYCLHSRNDQLVPIRHGEEMTRLWSENGGYAGMTVFDGDGHLHGFWIDDNRAHLRPEVGSFINSALQDYDSLTLSS